MAKYTELHEVKDIEKVWESSSNKPTLLFKHSTTCPVSAKAYEAYNQFVESHSDKVNAYLVKVIEDRDVSNQIETKTNIKHESPQIFLINNDEVAWNSSHSKITEESINQAIDAL